MLAPSTPRPYLAVLALVAALAPRGLAASPFEDTTLDGSTFTGPTHPHATAIYVNPAALGLAALGTHLFADAAVRLDQTRIERLRLTDPDAPPELLPGVRALTATPGGMIAAYNVGTTASLGVAAGLPMYQNMVGGEPSLGYHTLGGHHQQIAWVSFATSFRANERLFFGTGLWLTKTSLALSFLRDTALEGGSAGIAGDCGGAPCGIENALAAERYDVTVGTDGLLGTQNLAITAGVVYQVARDWWVGASYQSPPGLQAPLTLTGSVRVTPAPRDADAGREPFTAQAEVIYTLPQSVYLGVRGPLTPALELVAAVRWQYLSVQRQLDLRIFGRDTHPDTPEWYPRYLGFRDEVAVEAGVESSPGRGLRLAGRLRYESGATATEALAPQQIDGQSIGALVGVEIPLMEGLVLGASYGATWYPEQIVEQSLFDPRDALACVDSGHDIDACTPAAEGRALPSAAGTYGRFTHAARLSLRYSFL